NSNWTTTVTGGKGSKLISVMGPTPANGVISNDLLGHSGIITHTVSSNQSSSQYNGINVDGISANVADRDAPGVVVVPVGGYSQVVQGDGSTFTLSDQTKGSYYLVLTRPPDFGNTVKVEITPPSG